MRAHMYACVYIHVCVCVCVCATYDGLKYFKNFFVLNGYSEHWKVPPKITDALMSWRVNLNEKFTFIKWVKRIAIKKGTERNKLYNRDASHAGTEEQ